MEDTALTIKLGSLRTYTESVAEKVDNLQKGVRGLNEGFERLSTQVSLFGTAGRLDEFEGRLKDLEECTQSLNGQLGDEQGKVERLEDTLDWLKRHVETEFDKVGRWINETELRLKKMCEHPEPEPVPSAVPAAQVTCERCKLVADMECVQSVDPVMQTLTAKFLMPKGWTMILQSLGGNGLDQEHFCPDCMAAKRIY